MRCRSSAPSSPASTGAPGRWTSSRRSGRNAAKGSSRSAAISSPASRPTRSRCPEGRAGLVVQYYFATERGRTGYAEYTHDFNKLIWKLASPAWNFDDATYDRTAASFDNPDHVAIVIQQLGWRLGLARGEARYDELEQKLFAGPPITVPAITIASDFDGPGADGKAYANRYSGKHTHRILSGIGHNVPQEAPEAFAKTVLDVDASAT